MNKNIEVLVACMNQENRELYKKMNITTDSFFSNQGNNINFESYDEGILIRQKSMSGFGVGRNRNNALNNAQGDILLFSDDDIIYYENYDQIIKEAYEEYPDADVIIFNLEDDSQIKDNALISSDLKKLKLISSLRYGTPNISIRKTSIENFKLIFSESFGGGAKYSAGEDSLFLVECFKKKLKIYKSEKIIARENNERESSWFKGLNNKYYFDKGAWIQAAFPKYKYILIMYFYFQSKKFNITATENIIRLMIQGSNDYKNSSV